MHVARSVAKHPSLSRRDRRPCIESSALNCSDHSPATFQSRLGSRGVRPQCHPPRRVPFSRFRSLLDVAQQPSSLTYGPFLPRFQCQCHLRRCYYRHRCQTFLCRPLHCGRYSALPKRSLHSCPWLHLSSPPHLRYPSKPSCHCLNQNHRRLLRCSNREPFLAPPSRALKQSLHRPNLDYSFLHRPHRTLERLPVRCRNHRPSQRRL
mmetsp:Transcript_7893/g.11514  ORF Transcript_7893/g.11514 Transcript_7893/m.11514 type:complete len:207 (+) Transcript_7893:311-931(+)